MKDNEVLQKEVQDAIKYEPLLHAAEIGVIVRDGIVTLTGTVDNYEKKKQAEQAAKKVRGVSAVVEDIEVIIDESGQIPDAVIAADAVRMLKGGLIFPKDAVLVTLEDGWVTIEGTLAWNFQREMAADMVKGLPGVQGVINNIKLKNELTDAVEKKKIEDAFRRHWSLDTDYVEVKVDGNTVELSGTVCSLFQKEEAERIAYKTPGVQKVINLLKIDLEQPYLC